MDKDKETNPHVIKTDELRPILYLFVGLPGVGKSTIIKGLLNNFVSEKYVIISTDNIIEKIAKEKGLTYNDVFKDNIIEADKLAKETAVKAFDAGYDVFWDQTNLTIKSRTSKLVFVPGYYLKIACVVNCANTAEHERRLNSRPGKIIPESALKIMREIFTIPDMEKEGFDAIRYFQT